MCKDSAGKASLDLPRTVEEFNIFTQSPLVTCNVHEQQKIFNFSKSHISLISRGVVLVVLQCKSIVFHYTILCVFRDFELNILEYMC